METEKKEVAGKPQEDVKTPTNAAGIMVKMWNKMVGWEKRDTGWKAG